MNTNSNTRLPSFVLGGIVLGLTSAWTSTAGAATMTAPPGFAWVLVSTSTYTDSDSATGSDSANQAIRPTAAPPTITPVSDSVAVDAFDAAGTETMLESGMPGTDFMVCVTSSTFSAAVMATGSATIFNLDFAAGDVSGAVALSNFTMTGDATAGPASDALTNGNLAIAPFGVVPFDNGTGTTTASVNLNASGTAPTDGSTQNYGMGGSLIQAISAAPGNMSSNEFSSATVTYNVSAEIETVYEVYQLVPIPEPNSALLTLSASALLLLRRKRA